MALTKVTGQVVNTSTDLTVGVLTATTASFTGNVSVGGTLTYEDVTNVDSVGLITARNGISVTGSNISVESSEDRLLYLKSTDANAYLTFEDTDSSSGFANRIGSVSDGLYFSTGGGGERARIDSSGRIGIGMVPHTSSTGYALQIDGGASSFIQIFNDTSGNTVNDGFVIGNDANTAYLVNKENTPLVFRTNNTERLRIDSSGNMGLGTASPSGLLHLAASSEPSLYFEDTGSSNTLSRIYKDGSSLHFNSRHTSAGQFVFNSENSGGTATERMRIDSSGNVGIKNTVAATIDAVNNAGTLVVGDGSSAEGITIYTSDSTSGELAFADGTSGSATQRGRIIYAHGDNSMRISTNGSEALRIDSSGRLLINHTADAAPDAFESTLQIVDTSYEGSSMTIRRDVNTDSSPVFLFAKSRSGSKGGHTSVNSGDNVGSIYFYAADGTDTNTRCAEIRAQIDGTPGSNDMPGRLTFYTTADGASSPTERLRIDQQGRLIINHTSNIAPDGYASKLQLCDTSYQGSSVVLRRDQNNTSGGTLIFAKSRATSKGGNTIVQAGDDCGSIRWYGNDGVDQSNEVCRIRGIVNGTPGSNDMPGALTFWTTPDGSNSTDERMRISSNGNVSINTTSSSNKLRVHEGSDTPNVVIVTGADESSEFLALGVNSGVPCVTAGGVSSTSASLAFRTADNGTESEVARFDSDGRLLVGATSASVSADKVLVSGQLNAGGVRFASLAKSCSASSSVTFNISGSTEGYVFVRIRIKVGYAGNAGYQMHAQYDYATVNYYTSGSTATRTDILQVEAANAQFNYSDISLSLPSDRTVRLTYAPSSGSGTHNCKVMVDGVFDSIS